MMNIYIESFSLLIIFLVFLFYIINRKSIIKYSYSYLMFNAFMSIELICDIIYMVLANNNNFDFVTYIFGKLFLCFKILTSFMIYVYALREVFVKEKIKFKIAMYINVPILFGFIISSIVTHSEVAFDITYNDAYLRGTGVIIAFVGSAYFLLNMFVSIYWLKKFLNRRKVLGLSIYVLLVTVCAMYKMLNDIFVNDSNPVYFIGITEAIGSLVIYALIENPENNIDSVLHVLNDHALMEYINVYYNDLRERDILLVSFDKNFYTTNEDFDRIMLSSIDKTIDHVFKIFRYDSTNFVVVLNKKENRDINVTMSKFSSGIDPSEYIDEIHSKLKFLPHDIQYESKKEFIDILLELIINNNNFDMRLDVLTNDDVNKVREDKFMSNIIDKAIKNNNIEMYFQGIFSLKKNKFESCEALVRICDEDNHIISPAKFIDIVERDGRIVELGKLIFENVCQFISTDEFKSLGLDYVEINISPKQLISPNFIEEYVSILKKYDIDPKKINFEITETSSAILKRVVNNMSELRKYGITFSLDDFGTGNSNLNYIVNMPVDIVKFDKSMVNSYFNDNIASFVVDYSIKMIKGLGHKIVFEGVEQSYEVDKVKNLDVDYIQGYYFSKPLKKSDFITLVKEKNKIVK